MNRRTVLAGMAATAVSPFTASGTSQQHRTPVGELLVTGIRDAMLSGDPGTAMVSSLVDGLDAATARTFTDFDNGRYAGLAVRLPGLIRAGHAATARNGDSADYNRLAEAYLLATRMLIKVGEQELGWMAADRARRLAQAGGDELAVAESARQLAVLVRRAGLYDQALTIAVTAADTLALGRSGPSQTAVRGLLVQSAAYTAAKAGDTAAMRELTGDAEALAAGLGGTALRDHSGGFSTATVRLHLISAENSAGDPAAALAAARTITPHQLPSPERRARYYTDVAAALGTSRRRAECVRALLAAEHHAGEDTYSRPAVRSLIASLLVSGRTTSDLRGLAVRAGVAA
ncbi:XRE family transcriptional regulator [Streptomyces sp. NPDC097610]|uniref:XRE family transcriptional regulator n=1 Tax=Streptomyces sp. NPDC097610 TaxID=3157227 RepID=UPI003320CEE8